MHLVTRVFDSVISDTSNLFSEDPFENEIRTAWYRQILRLIALTHDLGHPPFSHAAEGFFADGLKHEYYTKEIIRDTVISGYIVEIGNKLQESLAEKSKLSTDELIEKYKIRPITPQLLWMIYGEKPAIHDEYIWPDFVFLKSFMDGELDCDKMDYLLRDSLYCGVTYGKYDLNRFVSILTVYRSKEENILSLAICSGGVQAFEEFVLARYFMFIQVYFHKTRRCLDRLLVAGMKEILPNGVFPEEINNYLKWDDTYVLHEMKQKQTPHAKRYLERKCMTCVYETPAHATGSEKKLTKSLQEGLEREFPDVFFQFDDVDKKAHKLLPPVYSSKDGDENEIRVIDKHTGEAKSVMHHSLILKGITDSIYICRLYADADKEDIKRIKSWINAKDLEYSS